MNKKNSTNLVFNWKSLFILLVLIFGYKGTLAQSIFTEKGRNATGIQYTYSSLESLNSTDISLSFSFDGIFDLGMSYGWFQEIEASYVAPQLGVLFIKSEGGFNLSSNIGVLVGLEEGASSDFAYGFSVSQKLGIVLPFLSISNSVQSDQVAFGGGLSFLLSQKDTGTFFITPSLHISGASSKQFSLSIGHTFQRPRKNLPGN